MTAELAIRRYAQGILPAPSCASLIFQALDAYNVNVILPQVHADVMKYMDEFAASYTPDAEQIVIGLTEPLTPEQVELFRAWRRTHC